MSINSKTKDLPETINSSAYKEALAEAKKLKELARAEAKDAIVEVISPVIQEMMEKDIINKNLVKESFIIEQEEDQTVGDAEETNATLPLDVAPQEEIPSTQSGQIPPATEVNPAGAVPPLETKATMPIDSSVPAGTVASSPVPGAPTTTPIAAPISAPPSASVPMPGQDGTITVDLSSLYVQTPPGQDPVISEPSLNDPTFASPEQQEAEVEAAINDTTSTSGQIPVFENQKNVDPIKASIKEIKKIISLSEKISSTPNFNFINSIKEKIMSLYELNQSTVSVKQRNANNFLLELLHKNIIELETRKIENSYRQVKIKEDNMKKVQNLKEFAASLFESADLKTGDNKPKGSAGFGDGGETAPKHSTPKDVEAKSNAMRAGAKKNQTNSGKDVEDPEKGAKKTLEENLSEDSDLLEAFGLGGSKEGPLEEGEEVKEETMEEGSDLLEVADEVVDEVVKESLQKKLASLREEAAKLEKQLNECGMEENMGSNPNKPVTVTLTIDGASDVSVDHSGADMDDEVLSTGDVDDDSDDLEIELAGDDDEEEDEESDVDSDDDSDLLKENKALKAQLKEERLTTAKSLYINKIFANNELSDKQKQTVVEYLDKANTINEAKEVYSKLVNILERKARVAKQFGGSSSRSTKSGAVSLSENKNNNTSTGSSFGNSSRWMQLAGINKKG